MKIKRVAYHDTEAHRNLLKLAEYPYDLTIDGALQRKNRLCGYVCLSKLFSLFYCTQRVDDEVLDGLQKLADECELVSQFTDMKNGAVVNTIAGVESENRQALHTASRDIFSRTPRNVSASALAAREMEKLKTFLEELDRGVICNEDGDSFTTMIHVGIGGSDLGPRSVFEALKPFGREGREVHFISNVDPDDAAAVLHKVDLRRCLVNIVSKSGTTLETLTNEKMVQQAFAAAGIDPTRHFLAVTGQGSPMDNPQKYLRSFYMFDYIGGRYSTTSMVGGVMLGFYLGYEQVVDFLKGAAIVDREAEIRDIRKNLPLLMAMLGIWNHNYLSMATLAVLPYSQALHRFPAHLQQCDMESNGKMTSRDGDLIDWSSGPVVWGEPGTNGQHAFYQLLHQGTEVVPCEFIGFLRSQYEEDTSVNNTTSQQKLLVNLLAQSVALATGQKSDNPNKHFPGNRPNSVLMAKRLTPKVMGGLLALYEAKIVFQGFAWNINSFDQEGVQLGKVLASRFLDEIEASGNSDDSLEKTLLEITEII
jgi:glucose-6-phosphate isomerase